MAVAMPGSSVELVFSADPRLKARDHNKFMRAAFTAGAEYHFRQHVPRHFEDFAIHKYGYYPRSEKYNDRKMKQVGHNHPLVFTGASKRMATGSHLPVQATPKGATLTVRLAFSGGSGRMKDAAAIARLHAAGKRINSTFTEKQVNGQIEALRRVSEMESMSSDEVNTVGRVILDKYTELANAPGTEYRKRIKLS